VNATAPKVAVSTSAAAADWTEWPDVYSGKGGVVSGSGSPQLGSMWLRMKLIGRSRLWMYLMRQQAMNASQTAMPSRA
jgi:hypothetical protein